MYSNIFILQYILFVLVAYACSSPVPEASPEAKPVAKSQFVAAAYVDPVVAAPVAYSAAYSTPVAYSSYVAPSVYTAGYTAYSPYFGSYVVV